MYFDINKRGIIEGNAELISLFQSDITNVEHAMAAGLRARKSHLSRGDVGYISNNIFVG